MNSQDFALPTDCSAPDFLNEKEVSKASGKPSLLRTPHGIAHPINKALKVLGALTSGWSLQPKQRRLRVSETVSLGEKRFVSIVEVDGQTFLIGGGTAGVSLLTNLAPSAGQTTFQQTAQEAWQKAGAA